MNDETTPRKPRQLRNPDTMPAVLPDPLPPAFYRNARRDKSITNHLRARFRGLQLLDTADPDIVLAVGEVMMRRYADEPAMRSFVADLWRSAQCWADEWQESRL